MYSNRYRERHAKINLITKEISIRGFVRELKSLLLDNKKNIFKKAEYKAVSNAYESLVKECIKSYSVAISADFQTELIGSSGYSDWWLGKKYPMPINRTNIDILIPGLVEKWFDRKYFKNRMQMHLASLDIFHMSLGCNCKTSETETGLNDSIGQYCDKCLLEAISDAEQILNKIHKDWRPQLTGFDTSDVCISGPKDRAVAETNEQLTSQTESYKAKEERMKIDFDLSLEKSSLIGLNFPYQIMKTYHDGNALSVVQFLFLLICMNIKTECEYRNDLILDFMTALNCAALLMFVKHKSIYTNPFDYIENNIQKIVMSVSELFYEESFHIKELLNDFENICIDNEKNGTKMDSSVVYPFTHFPEYLDDKKYFDEEISSVFFEILEFQVPYWDEKTFMDEFKDRYETYEHRKTEVDDYLSKSSLEIFKPFEAAKERYFEQFHFIGYTKEQLSKELSEMFVNPFGSNFRAED